MAPDTVSRVTYQDPTFDLAKLQLGGVAILPVLAGAGVEGYRRPFGESINAQARGLYGAEHVVHWDAATRAINGAGLSGTYGDAIAIYRETSILPSDILLEIGSAVKSRYLLVVTLNPPTSSLRPPPI